MNAANRLYDIMFNLHLNNYETQSRFSTGYRIGLIERQFDLPSEDDIPAHYKRVLLEERGALGGPEQFHRMLGCLLSNEALVANLGEGQTTEWLKEKHGRWGLKKRLESLSRDAEKAVDKLHEHLDALVDAFSGTYETQVREGDIIAHKYFKFPSDHQVGFGTRVVMIAGIEDDVLRCSGGDASRAEYRESRKSSLCVMEPDKTVKIEGEGEPVAVFTGDVVKYVGSAVRSGSDLIIRNRLYFDDFTIEGFMENPENAAHLPVALVAKRK